MANVLITPASGAIYFNEETAGGSTVPKISSGGIQFSQIDKSGLEIESHYGGLTGASRFSVVGDGGQLLGVTDSLTGDIFSVNDASGLPIINVNSCVTDVVTIGTYGTNTLVTSAGNVGIGTGTPTSKLEVIGDAKFCSDIVCIKGTDATTSLVVDDGASGAHICLESRGSGEAAICIGGENSSISRTGGDLNFYANGVDMEFSTDNGTTTSLFIDTSDKVGIRTQDQSSLSDSANTLVVGSGTGCHGITIYSDNADTGNLYFADGTSGDQVYRGYVIYNHDSNKLLLGAGAATRITATNHGKVGIMTTNPLSAELTIAGSVSALSGYCSTVTGNTVMGTKAMLLMGSGALCNTAIGYRALLTNSTGDNNVAVGAGALQNNTTGSNTAVGLQALHTNTGDGSQNTAIGLQSMFSNAEGYQNTAVGEGALFSNTSGLRNVAVGCGAAYGNTTGDCNVAIGCEALKSNQTSNYNVAVGSKALYANLGGACNVAVGSCALVSNTCAVNNTAVGQYALCSNTTGDKNNAFGTEALCSNIAGTYNTAIGYRTLFGNTSGDYNIAIGRQALDDNTTGGGNIALGRQTLWKNTEAGCNVGIGHFVLNNNTGTACQNVGVGTNALYTNTTGVFNNAIGACTLYYNSTGYHNEAIGYHALYNNTGGFYNIGIGREPLKANTHGTYNVAIGYRSLCKNTTASNNIGIGGCSLHDNTTGCCNVAIAFKSLENNTTGNYNVGIGPSTLLYNATGLNNVAIGAHALAGGHPYSNSGSSNVAIGYQAMFYNRNGNCNVALGYNALYTNICGSHNTSIGWQSMYYSTSGDYNFSAGYRNLMDNTIGRDNVSLGYLGLTNNTTGCCNIAIGSNTLHSNTIGTHNIAIGPGSLKSVITGGCNVAIGTCALTNVLCRGYNTAVGYETLKGAISAASNTAVGFRALLAANSNANTAVGLDALRCTTAGVYNEALGYQALRTNSCGYQNVGIGTHALYSNTTGNNNTAVGFNSSRSNTTGHYNTSIGLYSLCNNTDGDCNAAVGYAAGRFENNGSSAVTSPDNSTYLGACTRSLAGTPVNETVIGFCACGCGNNSVVLGNDDVAGTYLKGKVGIGTMNSTPPPVELTVSGEISSNNCLKIGPNPGNCLTITNQTLLRSQSDTGYLEIGSANGSYAHIQTDRAKIYFNKCLVVDTGVVMAYNEDLVLGPSDGGTVGNGFCDVQLCVGGATRMHVASGGNIGIGTTSPGATLDIHTGTNTNGIFIREDSDDSITHNLYVDSNDSGVMVMYKDGQTAQVQLHANGDNYICCNLGIGEDDPGEKLTVAGNISALGNVYLGQGKSVYTDQIRAIDSGGLYVTDDASNGIFIKDGGNVAIGSSTADDKLHICGGSIQLNQGYGYGLKFSDCSCLVQSGDLSLIQTGNGHIKIETGAAYCCTIFCGNGGSGKATFATMDFANSVFDINGMVRQNTQLAINTATAKTLVIGDHGKLLTLDNGSAITLTVPPNSSVAFPIGAEVTIVQKGAGQVTIAAGSGVTLYAADNELKTRVQYSSAVLTKIATDTWLVAGDLTA